MNIFDFLNNWFGLVQDPKPPKTEGLVFEARCKFKAKMMLHEIGNRFLCPDQEEWIGLNLLERDGEI